MMREEGERRGGWGSTSGADESEGSGIVVASSSIIVPFRLTELMFRLRVGDVLFRRCVQGGIGGSGKDVRKS